MQKLSEHYWEIFNKWAVGGKSWYRLALDEGVDTRTIQEACIARIPKPFRSAQYNADGYAVFKQVVKEGFEDIEAYKKFYYFLKKL